MNCKKESERKNMKEGKKIKKIFGEEYGKGKDKKNYKDNPTIKGELKAKNNVRNIVNTGKLRKLTPKKWT